MPSFQKKIRINSQTLKSESKMTMKVESWGINIFVKKKMMTSVFRINCCCHHHGRLLCRAMLGERMAANGDWMGCSSRVIWARHDRQLNMELGIWNVQIEWRGMSDRMAHHFR